MKIIIMICFAGLLSGCNSSAPKKESNKSKDDSSRKDNSEIKTNPVIVIEPVKITAAQLPASIKFKGKLFEAWQWTDKSGENILVNSFEEPYRNNRKNEDGIEEMDAGLQAAQYVKKEGGYQLLWKETDGIKGCLYDVTCSFIKGSTTVTDLDKDGIAESTVQYRQACRSDVSPSEMKIIMHEDTARYYLRGLCWIKTTEEDQFTVSEKNANLETLPGYKKTDEEYMKTFGRYESEKGFAGTPPEFLSYARKQWMKFAIESFE